MFISFYFGLVILGLFATFFIFLKGKNINFTRRLDNLGDFCDELDSKLDSFINIIFNKIITGFKKNIYKTLLKVQCFRIQGIKENSNFSSFHLNPTIAKSIEQGVGLEEKINKLDELIVEKSCELEKSQKALLNEIENRKEFEKIFSLLNQQINQEKSKQQQLNIQVVSLKDQNEERQGRIVQLIEEISRKNKKINDYQENTISLLEQMKLLSAKLAEFENFDRNTNAHQDKLYKFIPKELSHNGESFFKSF